jgi:replicative DNA helicase
MVELQVLSRILKQGNMSLIRVNGITEDYFATYPDEYKFIEDHISQYGNVPDRETFLAKFPNFTIVDVTETDKYLIDTFNEEHLYAMTVPVINKVAEIIQTDSGAAVEYLQSQIPNLMRKNFILGKDIISGAEERLKEWEAKKANPKNFSIPTGFPQLDEITGGWQRGEEFVVIFARTGQGKSWILIKSLEHAWKMGYRVGLLEPEMSAIKTGYRFDTLTANISNTSLLRGKDIDNYHDYIQFMLGQKVPFFVTSPRDFNRKVTISKLRSFVEANQIDILGIDGITYLKDERAQRGDNRTTALTNISEDIMDLSIDLKIPILVVAQSNREGAKEDDEAPDLENIRDSDGIAYNASTVIAAKQKGPGIELVNRKHRNGRAGDKLLYLWDIDIGKFQYIPSEDAPRDDTEHIQSARREFKDGSEVF